MHVQNSQPATERSRQSILGMPVLSIQEGIPLGNIKQLLLDGKTYCIQAFVVERRRLGKEDKLLPFSAVRSFGEDGITIETQTVLERKGASHQYVRALRQPLSVIAARVFTENGKSLGKVEEYRFSTVDGSICGLELSGGLFKDKMLVPGKHIIAIAPQTIMLRDAAIEEAVILANTFRSSVENAAETVKEHATSLKNSTIDTTKKISVNFNDAMRTLWERNPAADPAELPFEDEADPEEAAELAEAAQAQPPEDGTETPAEPAEVVPTEPAEVVPTAPAELAECEEDAEETAATAPPAEEEGTPHNR